MSEGEERYIFLNGKFVTKEEAVVSVFDHGFLYGDGIFEGIRAYDGNIFKLQEHIDRLFDSAKSILLDIPYTHEEMIELTKDTVAINNLKDAYIRLVVSRGVGDLSLSPFSCQKAQVIIIVDQVKLFPQEMYDNGIPVVTVPTKRNNPDALNPKIKSLNYLNNILAKIEAAQAGVLEALMLNADGYVAEGTGDNIFIIKNGIIRTTPGYLGALEGITRRAIIEKARELKYVVEEAPFTRHDVFVADEVFLTGTAAEVIAVTKVDNRVIGLGKPGPITQQLLAEFRKMVVTDGEKVDYSKFKEVKVS